MWVAPVGTKLGDSGWQPIGFANETPTWLRNDLWPDEFNRCLRPYVSAVDQIAARLAREQYGNFRQRIVLGIDEKTFNERSKPMGLTTSHKYTDEDGDTIEASEASWAESDATAVLRVVDSDSGEQGSAFVNAADSVSLALNVLGHDRPHILSNFETTVGDYKASGVVINSTELRDKTLANAIASLKSVDRYDQRVAERKAEEEAKAARAAEQSARIAAKDEARARLAEVVNYAARNGITRLDADSLQIAVADYKKAVDAVGEPSAL